MCSEAKDEVERLQKERTLQKEKEHSLLKQVEGLQTAVARGEKDAKAAKAVRLELEDMRGELSRKALRMEELRGEFHALQAEMEDMRRVRCHE